MKLFEIFGQVILKHDKADEELERIDKKGKGLAGTLGKAEESIGKAGSTLTKFVTGPIVLAGGLVTKFAIDFESAFAGVRKTVDATEEEFAALSKGIRDMSKEIPASAVEISKVAEAAGQLGIEKEAILEFARTMIDLGESTNLSADQAATALARLANITQMPQTEFGRLGSTVVALGNNLATTEAEIVEMGLRLAGAGKQVGMTEAEILSLAGALSSVGVEAQAGGSAFSRVITQMQLAVETGGKDLKNFASVAGMSGEEFRRAFQEDAAGALTAFVTGLGTAEEHGVSAIKVLDDMGITEIRLRDALLRTAGAGDLLAESIAIGTQAWAENTALTTEAEQRYETTASQLKILRNRLVDAGIALGDNLLPVLKDSIVPALEKLIGFLGRLVEWFGNLSPGIQTAAFVLVGLVAAIGPLLMAIKTLIELKQAWAAVQGLLNIVLSANPIGAVILAIMALIAIIIVCIEHWDEIVAFLAKAWNWIKETALSVWGAIGDFFTSLWDSIKDLFSGAIDFLMDLFFRFTPLGYIIANFDKIVAYFQGFKDRVVGFFIDTKDKIRDAWDRITGTVKGAANTVIGHIESMVNWCVRQINRFIGSINSAVDLINKIPGVNIGKIKLLGEVAIPRLAKGGSIQHAGAVMVGEEGPEILHLPRGAVVKPLSGAQGDTFNLYGDIVIDASKIKDIQDIVDLFRGIKQERIARGVA